MDSEDVSVLNVSLVGSGERIIKVEETADNTCKDIHLENFLAHHVGYLTAGSGNPDIYTVEIRSENTGTVFEGVDNVSIARGLVALDSQPAGLSNYESAVLIESDQANIDQLTIRYNGSTVQSLRALLYLSRCDDSTLRRITMSSEASVRAGYWNDVHGCIAKDLQVDTSDSEFRVEADCTGIFIDYVTARSGFETPIQNIINTPHLVLFE